MRQPISLGQHCDVAFQLRMHTAFNTPFFFDWLGTPAEGLIKILEHNFDVFHAADLILQTDAPIHYITDRATGVVLFHQFPFIGGHQTADFLLFYQRFRKICDFQARRFREAVTTSPVTLVRRNISQDQAIRLEASFFRLFPNADTRFLYLVNDDNLFTTQHGHARFIPPTTATLGEPSAWLNILRDEGLLDRPFRHATTEILHSSDEDHNLSPDDRFSEQDLLLAIESNPAQTLFSLELARLYRRNGQFEEAQRLLLEVLAISPEDPTARYELCLVQWQSGTYSVDVIADALKMIPRPQEISGLLRDTAIALLESNQLSEAAIYCQRASNENPVDDLNYQTLSMVRYQSDDLPGALSAIEVAIRLNGGKEVYYHLRGRFLDGLGRLQDALISEQQCLSLGGGFQSLCHKGSLLERLGDPKGAVEAWQQALPMANGYTAIVQGWIDNIIKVMSQTDSTHQGDITQTETAGDDDTTDAEDSHEPPLTTLCLADFPHDVALAASTQEAGTLWQRLFRLRRWLWGDHKRIGQI